MRTDEGVEDGPMRHAVPETAVCLLLLLPTTAWAETYQVGPDKPHTTLQEVTGLLQPGDVVEVDGGQTYAGGVTFGNEGDADNPITVRGIVIDGQRPVIEGGGNTIEVSGDHYIFEGLDITNGTNRCFYHHADDVVLRDSVIHDCPRHGVLGADSDSGSLLLEYIEVHHCGGGTQDHQIYMATDETAYPGSVFRMQHCYVHDANGGNNVKSRAERNEIYYNWIEGARFHEIELIGPDGQNPDLAIENGDVVGNVLIKTETSYVTRFGGDGTGQTFGHYRFVNNTVVVQPEGSAVFRLFDGIGSLEAHNNVMVAADGGSISVLRDVEANWADGSAIFGSFNWIPADSRRVPETWTDTIVGDAPGFIDLASLDLRPLEDSVLVDAGLSDPPSPVNYPFPEPQGVPAFHPPNREWIELGSAQARPAVDAIDIGAFEWGMAPPMGDTDGGSTGGDDGGGGDGTGTTTTTLPTSGDDDGLPGGDDSSTMSGPSVDTDTDAAAQGDDDGGCSCSTRSDEPASGALLLLGLAAMRRRRDRTSGR